MTGTHFHALDEKGRVIIPAKLRPALTEQFWLMLDESDNVAIYNYQTGLDVLAHCENMMADNPGDEDIAAAVERITGAAEMVSVEGNWRVQVSELLRFHAQLDKEIVTVGVLNHAVMWSREKWENAQVRRLQSTEVRRAQAGMLRAAASGIRKKAHEQARQIEAEKSAIEEEYEEPAAVAKRSSRSFVGSDGIGNADVDASGRPVKAVAPAGDGKRSPRVLTLSQLGR
jgi:MraZ protein